jgi:hypothetical protein
MIRFFVTLGLLLVPAATAHAAFIEDFVVQEDGLLMVTPTPLEPLPVFQEDHQMTRGEFTALLIRSRYSDAQISTCFWEIASSLPPRFSLVFADVGVDDQYSKEICLAMHQGIVRYGDGQFEPNSPIAFSEAATMFSRAYALEPYADADTVSPWYYKHVRALVGMNAVPSSITKIDQRVTAQVATEMLERLQNGITTRPSQTEQVLFPVRRVPVAAPVQPTTTSTPAAASTSTTTSTRRSSSAQSVQTSSVPAGTEATSEKSWWDLF